jgi:hypothetical protein
VSGKQNDAAINASAMSLDLENIQIPPECDDEKLEAAG